ncbi:hypothetical protein D3C81_1681350 [compost metagenome]
MILGDVVQIVGDTFAHIQRGVSFQLLQHRQDRGRVALEHRQRLAPGQAWPAAFTGQPPHMLIVMARPDQHLRHHPLRVMQHKRPDGKLSRRSRGEPFQRCHRQLPVLFPLPVYLDEIGKDQVRKTNTLPVYRV